MEGNPNKTKNIETRKVVKIIFKMLKRPIFTVEDVATYWLPSYQCLPLLHALPIMEIVTNNYYYSLSQGWAKSNKALGDTKVSSTVSVNQISNTSLVAPGALTL